jgi:hypothetical protein
MTPPSPSDLPPDYAKLLPRFPSGWTEQVSPHVQPRDRRARDWLWTLKAEAVKKCRREPGTELPADDGGLDGAGGRSGRSFLEAAAAAVARSRSPASGLVCPLQWRDRWNPILCVNYSAASRAPAVTSQPALLARAPGQLAGPLRRTDAWTGQSVPRFLYCRLHRRSIWTRSYTNGARGRAWPRSVATTTTISPSPRRLIIWLASTRFRTRLLAPHARPRPVLSCPFQDLSELAHRRHPSSQMQALSSSTFLWQPRVGYL